MAYDITMSHVWVDFTIALSGKLMLNGCVAICTLFIFNPSITKREVPPVSATACVVANDIVFVVAAIVLQAMSWHLLDVTTVVSSLSTVTC